MDPALWELLTGDPQEEVAAVVRLRAGSSLPVGVRLVSRFGEVATCRLRRGAIPQVRHHPGVVSLKAPRRYTADLERIPSGGGDEPSAGDARRPAGESAAGRGVVVGVVDWGCDFAHADFRRPDGTTRLLALWDQRAGSTAARSPIPFGYGTVHTAADINRALTSTDAYAALGYHPADSDVDGLGAHGTHVLGIAAGNGRAGGPVGVAPAADLVFVQFAAPRGDEAVWIGDSATLLEAIDFIARTAAGRPVVINLSLGRHAGSHDGTTLVEQAIDFFLAAAPGRAVVQSAGNYFSRDIHVAGHVRPGEVRSVIWETSPTDRTANELDIWYPGRDRLTIEIRDPGGHLAARVRPGERTAVKSGNRAVGRIYHRSGDPNNRDNQVEVFLDRSAPAGEWEVRVVGDDVADGRFHAWVERDAGCRGCQSQFAHADANPLSTTGSICNGFRTIAVGAYDPHDPNKALGRFSSAGPTRDGRTKPDLVAPGVDILAARSALPGRFTATDRLTRMSGTSMAAPHVTGAVACVFEAAGRPLAVHETRAVLLSSCTPGEPTSAVHQARLGSGYLDLEQALTRARELGRSGTLAGTSAMARNRPPLESEANSHECGCQGRADRPRGGVASLFAEAAGRTGSAYVRWLQSALNRVMATRLAVNGIIGRQTVQAVRAFQRRSGLVADGVVGSKTEAALIAAGAASPPGITPTPTSPGVAPPPNPAPGPRPPGGSVLAARPVAILDRFAFDQFALTQQHREQVAHVATQIIASQQTAAPVHRVTLVGHTDNVGQAAYNRTLGQRRADAARQELTAAVEEQQPGASQEVEFHSVSDGADFPVAPNSTEDGRARNHRVEIFLNEAENSPPLAPHLSEFEPKPPKPEPRPQPPSRNRWYVPDDCSKKLEGVRVAVVGGGFAGLMAARRLGNQGLKVTVFEARDRLGGRVWSDTTLANGRITEFGAELIGSFHTTWLELAREYGLAMVSRMDAALYEKEQLKVRLKLDKLLTMREYFELERDMRKRVLEPMAEHASQWITDPSQPWLEPDSKRRDDLRKRDAVSVATALRGTYGVKPDEPLWRMLEHKLVNDEVARLEHMNFLGLLCKVRAGQGLAFSSDDPTDRTAPLMRYWDELEIYRCADGSQALATRMAEHIKRAYKVEIKPRRVVRNIDISKAGVGITSFNVTDQQEERFGGPPEVTQYQYVILAIPPSIWPRVEFTVTEGGKKIKVSPEIEIGTLGTDPAVKHFTPLTKRFWIERGHAPYGGSMSIGQVWEGTDNQTQVAGQGIVLSVFAGPCAGTATKPRVPDGGEIEDGLKELYPGYKDKADLTKNKYLNWPNEPFIKMGYYSPRLGEIFKVGELLTKPYHDRLFFAGEHTTIDFFGYMEGALVSGVRAADRVMQQVCRRLPR